MRLASPIFAAGLSFSLVAAPSTHPNSESAVAATDVPGTQFRKPDPTQPIPDLPEPSWEDTADTSDELRLDVEPSTNSETERDLNNDVHDPLLESPISEPVEADRPAVPHRQEPQNPVSDPLP